MPAGPFTTGQTHAELAAGRATRQTSACPVGGTTWLPLFTTPGSGPAADGGVCFLREQTALGTLAGLATRAGGEVVNPDGF